MPKSERFDTDATRPIHAPPPQLDIAGTRHGSARIFGVLITYEARVNGLFQPVIPAQAGMTGFRGACPPVSIDRGSQPELCV